MKRAELFDAAVHFFYPRRCVGCGNTDAALTRNRQLCPSCMKAWTEALNVICPTCGKGGMLCRCAPKSRNAAGCGISAYYHLVPYKTAILRTMLFRIKDKPHGDTAHFLGIQMANLCEAAIRESGVSREQWIITYPPRTEKKAAKTGTDQTAVLGHVIAERTKLPFVPLLHHEKGGFVQKELTAEERRENADKSYTILPEIPDIRGLSVILLDDVITTGATTAVCAGILYAAGAANVVCVTAARA